jgi:hypothetical protein
MQGGLMMKTHERLIDGIKDAVNRHWKFTKSLLRIEPEYLLTVSIADALSDGFDELEWEDLEIHLEERTHSISADLLLNAVGWKKYFKLPSHRVSRKGKVDIYVTYRADCWIIEIKGFDPSVTEVRKEIVRLQEFLAANGGVHKCRGCFLVFPTATDKREWINQQLLAQRALGQLYSERVETGEEPEDGIPVYYANCIVFGADHIGANLGDAFSRQVPGTEFAI